MAGMILDPAAEGGFLKAMHKYTVLRDISDRLELAVASGDLDAKFNVIRELYGDAGGLVTDKTYTPYPVDWLKIFTPIEEDIWCYIRRFNLPFYPQFPVDRYFVDFGDPHKKIAIECDGVQWHSPEKDAKRQNDIIQLGWTLLRIPGWQCARPEEDLESAYWLIADIGHAFYGKREAVRPENE